MSQTGQITQYVKGKGYEAIPRELLQDHSISGESIHLICELSSYPENFKIFKTAIYKWREKNKRTQIDRMWKELISANYLIQFRKREGKKWNYRYIFSLVRFDQNDIDELIDQNRSEGFEPYMINIDSSSAENEQFNKPHEIKDSSNVESQQLSILDDMGSDDDFGLSNLNSSKPTRKRTYIQREEEDIKLNIKTPAREGNQSDQMTNQLTDQQQAIKDVLTQTRLFRQSDIQDILHELSNVLTLDLVNEQLESMREIKRLYDPKGYFICGIKKLIDFEAFKAQSQSQTQADKPKILPRIPMYDWTKGVEA